MSYGPNKIRARIATVLGATALTTTLLAVGSVWVQRSMSGETVLTGKVLPDFSADMPQVRSITIATREITYNLVRRGTIWVIPERGDYPVEPQALANLAKGLSDLSFKTARTSDPSQFAKLGVDDPTSPRSGNSDSVLLSLKGASSQLLGSLYLGIKADALFVRKAGTNDVFEADGKLPDLTTPAKWLDLKVIDITPETIASVSGQRAGEAAFDIVRRPDGGFAPVGGQANVTATTSAIALTKWSPLDVIPASTLTTDRVASHVTNLRSGLSVRAEAYNENGRNWVVLSAIGTNDTQTDAAATLNRRTDGWAFEVGDSDFADFTFSKSAIILGPDISPAP